MGVVLSTFIRYVDIAKAFDSVSHSKLLAKLHRYGIRCHLLAFACFAFLSDRKQRVKVDGVYSDWLPVESGFRVLSWDPYFF